ncbi:MAG: YigZ family protein, partial [Clostridiales bacterium]
MTVKPFLTLKKFACQEIIERKSRFIAYAAPIETEVLAKDFIDSIRSRHRDATHHVYAYQIGVNNQLQRSCDDGEPAGTAGRPVLEAIKKAGLQNAIVVVTRYFGGILLGAGGLTRVYGKAAALVLPFCGIVERIDAHRYQLVFDYHFLGKIEAWFAKKGYLAEDKIYTDKISFSFLIPWGQEQQVASELADLSGGLVHMLDL